MAKKLKDSAYQQVCQLCQEGDRLITEGEYDSALKEYIAALSLVPAPAFDWEASTWILTAIGDTFFHMKNYLKCRQVFMDAMNCPGAIGNPFIHLRLGQAQYELGDIDRAKDELVRAYMGGGDEIFSNDDNKYFELVKTTIII